MIKKSPALPKSHEYYIKAKSTKDKEINSIRVWVYWDEGGSSPFAETLNNPSGVAVSMSPGTKHDDGVFSYMATAGLRYIAAEAGRMNRKLILNVFDRVKYEIEKKLGKAWDVLQKVCEREGCTLE